MMKKEIGLWIDHREAILVILTDGKEEIKQIHSSYGKNPRYSSESAHSKSPEGDEDHRDRKLGNQLKEFYDQVIAVLRDAESVQIFGPGEAKSELQNRIEHEGLKIKVEIETTDKLTEPQIAAKVRDYFKA